jgi:hypothetical protein
MECAICLNDDAKAMLKCGHIYHSHCIKTWYLKGENGSRCPICRKMINMKFQKRWYNERKELEETNIWIDEIDILFRDYENVLDSSQYSKLFRPLILLDLYDDLLKIERILKDCRDIELFEEIMEDPNVILVMTREPIIMYDLYCIIKQMLFIADKHYDVLMSKSGAKNIIHELIIGYVIFSKKLNYA